MLFTDDRPWVDPDDENNQVKAEVGEMDERGNIMIRKRVSDSGIPAGPSYNDCEPSSSRSISIRHAGSSEVKEEKDGVRYTVQSTGSSKLCLKKEPTLNNEIIEFRHLSPCTSATDSNTEVDLFDVSDVEDEVKPNVMKCKFCGTDYKGKDVEAFICHLALKQSVKCLFCSQHFGCELAWISHCKKTHSDEMPAVNPECYVCHKTFSNRVKVINHMLTHLEEKNYVCRKCNQTYRTSRSLLSHISNSKKSTKNSVDSVEPNFKLRENKILRKCKVRMQDYPAVMASIKF